jgi:hypothetical protein
MEDETNFSFRGQREDEDVLIIVHQHPWALVKPGLFAALGLAIIILLFIVFKASGPSVWGLFILGPIIALYVAYHWFVWWNTLYVLTSQRAITITQRGFWSRRIEDYALDKIQSVASDTAGAAGTLMNFGDVYLAIMGIKDQISLHFVEDPREVQEKLLDAMRKVGHGKVHVNEYGKPKRRI